MHQFAKAEHHGVSSLVARNLHVEWYSMILGLLAAPGTSHDPVGQFLQRNLVPRCFATDRIGSWYGFVTG
jgi:hypothetical protein